ncbi:MAG: DUF58 domain-containing protein [Myxococcota bacterium]
MAEGALLEPAFLRRLERLRLLARRRFAGAAGRRRSTRRGQSVELADHRAYVPGDDVRRIDWNAYARLEELVLRLFVAEEDLTLHLFLDLSRSMRGEKLEQAKRLAAALAYVGLTGSERVAVAPFAATALAPLPPSRGRRRVGTVLRHLEALAPPAGDVGGTDLRRSVEAFLARRPRPGLVALISDLLDPAGFERPLDRLAAAGHEPVLFHVLGADELDPGAALVDAEGGADLALVDAERGRRVEVTLDAAVLGAYRRRLTRFLAAVDGYAAKRGLVCVRVGGEVAFEDALLTYLRGAA